MRNTEKQGERGGNVIVKPRGCCCMGGGELMGINPN
jgi:hypothetical protein